MPDGDVGTRTIVDAYLDTADGRLRAAGLAARIRSSAGAVAASEDPGQGCILTVKSLARSTAGPVHDRLELEGSAGDALLPGSWPRSEARALLMATIAGAPLEVIARIRQHRRTLVLRRGGARIELSLDDLEALQPAVAAGGGLAGAPGSDVVLARTTELEAELLDGPARELDLLGAVLLRLDGLRPATGSKLDWAIAAARAADGPLAGDGRPQGA